MILSQPCRRWKPILVAILLPLAGSAFGGCAGRASSPPVEPAGLRADLATDAARYRPGQPVRLSLTLTNHSAGPVTLRFTTGQRYDFRILDAADGPVWTWSDGRAFIMSLGSLTLRPEESLTYEEVFTGDLAPGSYQALGWVTDPSAGLGPARADFEVSETGR